MNSLIREQIILHYILISSVCHIHAIVLKKDAQGSFARGNTKGDVETQESCVQ